MMRIPIYILCMTLFSLYNIYIYYYQKIQFHSYNLSQNPILLEHLPCLLHSKAKISNAWKEI